LERGLYRLTDWPADPNENLLFATLWSRGLGVISHESALAFYDLGDLMPTEVHLTVPREFRKRPVEGIVLHRGVLQSRDLTDHGSFRTTTPARTLADVAAAQISPEHLTSAVASAVRRGLLQKKEVLDAALDLPNEASARLRAALKAPEEPA
jgi:predicted transcriptional regulator of viral defense system